MYLELDGTIVGSVRSFEGGNAVAQVVTESLGPGERRKKHIADVAFQNVVIECGLAMKPAFYFWINDTLFGDTSGREGALIVTDGDRNVKRRIEFTDALITEVTFPTLDTASPAPAFMTVRFDPEETRPATAAGHVILAPSNHRRGSPATSA